MLTANGQTIDQAQVIAGRRLQEAIAMMVAVIRGRGWQRMVNRWRACARGTRGRCASISMRGSIIRTRLTYEIHTEKEDFDLTAGEDLILNRGISQFLPLT